MEDRCLICGIPVPEGIEVCPRCCRKWLSDEDSASDILPHRTGEEKQTGKRGDKQSDSN